MTWHDKAQKSVDFYNAVVIDKLVYFLKRHVNDNLLIVDVKHNKK